MDQGRSPQGHGKTQKVFEHGTATYQQDYVQWSIQPTENYKPKQEKLENSKPFEGSSSYADAFVVHSDARPTPSCRPPREAHLNSKPFSGQSSYLQDFVKFSAADLQPRETGTALPAAIAKTVQPFTGSSSYVSDFKGLRGEKQPNYKPEAVNPNTQRPKFEGQSQSQSAYVQFAPQPQQNYKPQPSAADKTKDTRCVNFFLHIFCFSLCNRRFDTTYGDFCLTSVR